MIPDSLKPYQTYIFLAGFLAVIAFGIYIYKDMNRPALGSPLFGLCKSFIDLDIRYSETLNVTQVVNGRDYVEVYASFVNAHGVRPTRVYRCNFEQTPQGIRIRDIVIDFQKIKDERVEEFNMLVPFLINNQDIDRTLPNWEGMSLEALKP
jgi:hypothetical protein